VELGEHLVQGTDYAYTLQGWLKGINGDRLNPNTDMGRDGDPSVTSNPNLLAGRDAFALSLGYYGDSDYKAIGDVWSNVAQRPFAPIGASGTANTLADSHRPLYNGNIAHTVNTLQPFGLWDATNGSQGQVLAQVYRYDQLNRLKKARGFTGINSDNTWVGVVDAVANRYRSEYTYDANGNIETVERYDADGTGHYDSFAYHYHTNGGRKQQNRLYELIDDAPMSTGSDIVTTATGFDNTSNGVNVNNNYGYDALGNLVRDDREEIELIHWTVAGKVDSIQRPDASSRSPLKFRYGASGQRVSKQVGDFYCTEPGSYREHYIRDAQGNIMATYRYKLLPVPNTTPQVYEASLKLNERPLYGSSRLGSLRTEVELRSLPYFDPTSANPVQQVDLNYELTDHLGNVCAVVTGRLLDGNGGGTPKQAELVSAQGYEPFGSLLPGRNYSSGSYRYLFQGQEHDDEINDGVGTSYAFEYRIHDPRIGRFLSIDPLAFLFPWNSPYAFSENRVLDMVELEGLEAVPTPDKAEEEGPKWGLPDGGEGWTERSTQEMPDGNTFRSFKGPRPDSGHSAPDALSTSTRAVLGRPSPRLSAGGLGGSSRGPSGNNFGFRLPEIDRVLQAQQNNQRAWDVTGTVFRAELGLLEVGMAFRTKTLTTQIPKAKITLANARNVPRAPIKSSIRAASAELGVLKSVARRLGPLGTIVSLYDYSQSQSTMGDKLRLGSDIIMGYVTPFCPLCGLGYFGATLLWDSFSNEE
jgi:RHS repeat-associated protein